MFSVNEVFSDIKQSIQVKVCHVAIDLALIAVVDLVRLEEGKPCCKPKVYNFEKFADYIKKNKLHRTVEMLPAWINFDDEKLIKSGKEHWVAKRDKKLNIVGSLLNEDTVREYLYGSGVGEKIGALLIENSIWKKSSNYYRQLNRYITYGCTNNALLPFDYQNCGSNYFIPEERGVENVKRGRKTISPKLLGHLHQSVFSVAPGITKKEIKKIKKTVTAVISSARKNITARARLLYRRENECRFVDEATPYGTNKKLKWDEEPDCLSDAQFRYHFQKFITQEDKIRAAKGQIVFDKDHADRSGSTWEFLIGPTHLYEIDATVMDIHVRYPYSENERLSMGRPVLYVVVDVFSTCIVGIYIGFHGPDWVGAAEALVNAFMDKVSFAARYGLKINKKDWPCHHLCYWINSDNGGEYSLGNISPLLKANLGIQEWTKTRSYMGVAKAVAERKFGVINDSFLHYQPGAVYEVRREEQDPSQNAVWDLESLYQAIILEVIYQNHTNLREEHHDFKAAKKRAGLSAQSIFDFFIGEEMGGGNPTTEKDEGRIRLACLPENEASVTAQGIKFQGVYYTSPYAKQQKWYFRAKQFGVFPITVKWSRVSADLIWYQTPENEVIALKIKPDKSRRFMRQTWEAVAIRQHEYAREKHAAKREKTRQELIKEQQQRDLLDRNKEGISGIPENTVKSRQKGIQERKDEQAIIDKAQIDKRNKQAIGQIEKTEASEGDHEEMQTKPQTKKPKKRSLNSRLQRSKNNGKGDK
ncbi:hypothetical protein [Thalassotalea agarivorans]|uniref:Mu transposase, C-terminal n=1 Tax=Thalassotalea agarivorans TaxID=349064 RepID=A0A1I0BE20_THASX|nr:hypothetical protein [Thalassotalea agarivorans]SET05153.1 hypothetical protein SAMN05660429_00922 [Thalassotalea agarivorans]